MDKKEILLGQLKEERSSLMNALRQLESVSSLNTDECADLIKKTEKLYKSLIILQFLSRDRSLDSDFNVHVKIMQAAEIKKEIQSEINEMPPPPEITIENIAPIENEVRTIRKMEISLNDRYRFTNDLFHQNTAEFNAAIHQINSSTSWDDAHLYLNTLLSLYHWKEEDPLVKSFYSAAKKRFS
jgi:hypothetical protein